MNRVLVVLFLVLLGGCDQLKDRMGMNDAVKREAEGKAIGAACRNAGQGLEDCYRLNPDTGKAAIYDGWKEMNEYMVKNNMQVIPPMTQNPPAASAAPAPEAAHDAKPAEAAPADKAAPSDKTKAGDKTKADDKAAKH